MTDPTSDQRFSWKARHSFPESGSFRGISCSVDVIRPQKYENSERNPTGSKVSPPPPFHPAQAVGPAFGVEGVVVDGAAGVPPEGPEEGGESDDEQVERSQEAGLDAVSVLMPDHLFIHRRAEIDEVSQGDAAPHVPGAHDADGLRDAGYTGQAPFPFQEKAHEESEQVLGQLPYLQEGSGQEGEGAVHITRTR